MTLEGTNTYLYGAEPCAVIDPGPEDAGHLDGDSRRGRGARRIGVVLLTHSHGDHARRERTRSGADGRAAGRRRGATPACASSPLPATPPTTSASHGDGVCFSGDLVLGLGSTIVPPGGGSLAAYMDSLRRSRPSRSS